MEQQSLPLPKSILRHLPATQVDRILSSNCLSGETDVLRVYLDNNFIHPERHFDTNEQLALFVDFCIAIDARITSAMLAPLAKERAYGELVERAKAHWTYTDNPVITLKLKRSEGTLSFHSFMLISVDCGSAGLVFYAENYNKFMLGLQRWAGRNHTLNEGALYDVRLDTGSEPLCHVNSHRVVSPEALPASHTVWDVFAAPLRLDMPIILDKVATGSLDSFRLSSHIRQFHEIKSSSVCAKPKATSLVYDYVNSRISKIVHEDLRRYRMRVRAHHDIWVKITVNGTYVGELFSFSDSETIDRDALDAIIRTALDISEEDEVSLWQRVCAFFAR